MVRLAGLEPANNSQNAERFKTLSRKGSLSAIILAVAAGLRRMPPRVDWASGGPVRLLLAELGGAPEDQSEPVVSMRTPQPRGTSFRIQGAQGPVS